MKMKRIPHVFLTFFSQAISANHWYKFLCFIAHVYFLLCGMTKTYER